LEIAAKAVGSGNLINVIAFKEVEFPVSSGPLLLPAVAVSAKGSSTEEAKQMRPTRRHSSQA
jgi:hypothetical protein